MADDIHTQASGNPPRRRAVVAALAGLLLLPALLTVAAQGALAADGKAAGNRVVVELFTSQGCSSCPPADRFLVELAKRDDVLPLSFHVDYWDYLGWKDPYSSAQATARQRDYRPRFGLSYVYTPQMVIGGIRQATGSHRNTVLREIDTVRGRPAVPVTVDRPDIDTALVTIAGGPAPRRAATVWLFAYDRKHATAVRRGENSGATLINANVVRAIRPIGEWSGRKTEIRVPIGMMGIDEQDGCAIVVQEDGTGPILGATDFPLKGTGG